MPSCPELVPAGGSHRFARFPIIAAVLLAAGVLIHARFGTYHAYAPSGHAVGLDDAFISFRYAANLAEGRGFVYNVGERVEGYSNLLYTVLLAVLAKVAGTSHLYRSALVMNLVFSVAALVLFARTLRRRAGVEAGNVGALLFALTPAFWLWTSSGLETALSLLALIGMWSAADESGIAGEASLALWCGVLILVRIDGFIPVGVVLAWLVVNGRWRAALRLATVALATMAAVSAWRLAYYGNPLPNTYYAKVTGTLQQRISSGLRHLRFALRWMNLWFYALAVLLSAAAGPRGHVYGRPNRTPTRSLELSIAAVSVIYFLCVGGDDLGERFLLPGVLMAIGMVATECGALAAPWRAIAVCAAVVGSLAGLTVDARFHPRFVKYDYLIELGAFLGHDKPREMLAIDAAGKVPFTSGLPTIDMLGLTDAHIAHTPARRFRVGHSKYDAGYVLGRRPGLIAVGVDPALDGAWGMTRQAYGNAGYVLQYLCNTRPEPRPQNIINVRGMGNEELKRLVVDGYNYGVLTLK